MLINFIGLAQNTSVPDTNFEQALIDLGYDNSPIDGFVPTVNINTITFLDVSNKNINSLTGIEDFTSLTTLWCSDNNLTSLNISQNLNLFELNCFNNQITSLNITQNTSLSILSCYNNELAVLDVSLNSVLTKLICNTNKLASLDVSKNLNLTVLWCAENLLTDIDVTKNQALQQLVCGSNKLTDIDVSKNLDLSVLFCGVNELTDIDVSKNVDLILFNCGRNLLTDIDISNNTLLTELICFENQLTNLDVSNNTSLTYLSCATNSLCNLDIRNGNNTNVLTFDSRSNPNLNCILVDDSSFSISNWSFIDSASNFVTSQMECSNLGYSNAVVDTLNNVSECENYILPTLTNGNYFTGSNGTGTQLNSGDVITSSQTIFIYANSCFDNQTSFYITISDSLTVDILENISACGSYTLPTLANGNYFTGSNGAGTQLNSGDVIASSQTIFIYNKNMNNSNCNNESSFDITINPSLNFSLTESNIKINGQDIIVNISDTSIDYEYAVDNNNFQNSNTFLNLIKGTHNLYVRDNNSCVEKTISFEITTNVNYSIPLYFTPNSDGKHDYWKVQGFLNSIRNITIFNRYGKLLKSLSPNSEGWDGSFNGKSLNSDDYWYVITLNSGETLKGHFALKR